MALPTELRESSDQLQFFSEEYKIKILGICWKPISDTFIFSIDLDDIAPVIIAFKCLIQQTWVEDISWDAKLPDTIANQWMKLRDGLSSLYGLEIPRCVVPRTKYTSQLHVFCDASEKGYAAVVYVRTKDCDGKV